MVAALRRERHGWRTALAGALIVTSVVALGCEPRTAPRAFSDPDTTLVTPSTVPSTGDSATSTTVPADDQGVVMIPGTGPITATARAQANDLLAAVRAAVIRHGWSDINRARADGYVQELPGNEHYQSAAALADGKVFDADSPETLMYDASDQLIGVMFMEPSFSLDLPPPPGSPLLMWHYHVFDPQACMAGFVIVTAVDAAGHCPVGSIPHRTSPLMVHIWLGPGVNPFSAGMTPAPLVTKGSGSHTTTTMNMSDMNMSDVTELAANGGWCGALPAPASTQSSEPPSLRPRLGVT